MQMFCVHSKKNDRVVSQHLCIIHLAFGVDTINQVDEEAKQLANSGFPPLSGPRKNT
jgi:lactoylglutathione lyase